MMLTEMDLRRMANAAAYVRRMDGQTGAEVRRYCEREDGDPWDNAAHLVQGAVNVVKSLLAVYNVDAGKKVG